MLVATTMHWTIQTGIYDKKKEVPGAKWIKYKCRILKNNISKQTEYNLTQAHASKDYRFKKILCDKSIKLQ